MAALFRSTLEEVEGLRLTAQNLERELSAYKLAYASVDEHNASLSKEVNQLKQNLHSLKVHLTPYYRDWSNQHRLSRTTTLSFLL